KDERGVLLVRPAKPETLATLIERVNRLQTDSGEVKAVQEHAHRGVKYFERKKAGGGSEFYCLEHGTLAFSSVETEVKAFIDRDRETAAVNVNPPVFAVSLKRLGLENAAAAMLVNPRALDAGIRLKIASGKPEEKAFLAWFGKYWESLDAAALYL